MMPQPQLATSYGQYILATGKGVTGQMEGVWGRFWYENYFRGLAPVADVGPGRCWFTRQDLAHIVAVDNAPDLVAHYRALGLRIELGSADRMPFPDAHFEGVFCCWLLEHLPDPESAILEFHRVLKPGGVCLIVAPTPADMRAFYDDYTHVRPYTAASLRQLAAVPPFRDVRTFHLPWTRGLRLVCSRLGEKAAYKYLIIAERWLRRAGLSNRAHIVLEARKIGGL